MGCAARVGLDRFDRRFPSFLRRPESLDSIECTRCVIAVSDEIPTFVGMTVPQRTLLELEVVRVTLG